MAKCNCLVIYNFVIVIVTGLTVIACKCNCNCNLVIYLMQLKFNWYCKTVIDPCRVSMAWKKVMAAYRRVYDSRHLQADCQELGSAAEIYALPFTFTWFQ